MSSATWIAVRQRVIEAYGRGVYAQALVAAEQALPRLPEHAAKLRYWQACLRCLVGDHDAALTILEQAIHTGLWFTSQRLETDPDLAAIRATDRFVRVLATSRERLARAQVAARSSVVTDAAQPDVTAPLLIALHGSGGDASMALEDWTAAAAYGWRVVAPQSSALIGPDEHTWPDWQQAAHGLGDHLAVLRQQYRPVRSIIAGFSRGGGMAVALTVFSDLEINGFIAVAPAWEHDEVDRLRTVGRRGPHGFIIVGGRDTHCVEQVEQVRPSLNATIEWYAELGHAYPPEWTARLPTMLVELR